MLANRSHFKISFGQTAALSTKALWFGCRLRRQVVMVVNLADFKTVFVIPCNHAIELYVCRVVVVKKDFTAFKHWRHLLEALQCGEVFAMSVI